MQNESMHKIIQGLVYPAFLGTFIVSCVQTLGNEQLSVGSAFKSAALFILFVSFYLETSHCNPAEYTFKMLFLDLGEIITMTANFAFIGIFSVLFIKGHFNWFFQVFFAWTGFFILNFFMLLSSEYYRKWFLPNSMHLRGLSLYIKYVFLCLAALSALIIYIDWGELLAWVLWISLLGLEFVLQFVSDYLPLSLFPSMASVGGSAGVSVGSLLRESPVGMMGEFVLSLLALLSTILIAIWAWWNQ